MNHDENEEVETHAQNNGQIVLMSWMVWRQLTVHSPAEFFADTE